MNHNTVSSAIPNRILYSMIRVTNLERSINFYENTMGMRILRREDFSEGRFTLVFLGYGEESTDSVLELTYNWDENTYQHGNSYGHLALQVKDIYAASQRLEQMDVKITRQSGPMNFAVDETGHTEVIAFIEDPDGYKIELIESKFY